jgi:hypothetical protein
MPNLYYRISDPSDVRDLGEQMAAWVTAGNPKAEAWAEQPAAPSADAVWQDGAWSVPPVQTYTAAEWVEKHLTSMQRDALSDLRVSILLSGKTLGPKMTAMHQWTSQMIVAGVTAPEEKRTAEAWGNSPWSFEAASQEALSVLAG